MHFERNLYIVEMTALVRRAFDEYQRIGDAPAYVISIWTDPNVAASAVSIETQSHSKAFLGVEDRINDSPADFEFRDIAECEHDSFSPNWEEQSSGVCWDSLEPALVEVGELAIGVFRGGELEPDSVLGVNSRRDWFDRRWTIQDAA